MYSEENTSSTSTAPFTNPWPALVLGVGAAGVALTVAQFVDHSVTPLGVSIPLVLLGLLGAGVAVAIRPMSPLVLGLSALVGLGVCVAMDPAWDSARLLVAVLSGTAGLAAVLMLLPRVIRRVAFSLIILFHFGGILSAALSVNPSPWLVGWTWLHVYRPYLEFMYLTNAYHFYSPEPGHGDLVKFYLKYEDGTTRWFKIPCREDNPVTVEYQRRLSLTQAINQLNSPTLTPEMWAQRNSLARNPGIPPHPTMDATLQYRPPQPFARENLRSFARHVTHTIRHPTNPDVKCVSVKIYRVVHKILTPVELNEGIDPEEPWLYVHFYEGEYDLDGNLINPTDPLLYWVIPIVKAGSEKGSTIDYVQQHAELGNTTRQERDPAIIPGAPLIPGASEKPKQ